MTLEKVPQETSTEHIPGFADTAFAQNLVQEVVLVLQAKAAIPSLPEGNVVHLAHRYYIDPADNPIRRFAHEAHTRGAVDEARRVLSQRVQDDGFTMGLFDNVVQALEHQVTPDGVIDGRIKKLSAERRKQRKEWKEAV